MRLISSIRSVPLLLVRPSDLPARRFGAGSWPVTRGILTLILLPTLCFRGSAQVSDHLVVYADDGVVGGARVLYFDHRLDLLNVANMKTLGGIVDGMATPAATDGEGITW